MALLIALFALLLICVIGVALIMASGTHSALTGNYRSATSVYYAALAGLEEGRGRLLPKSPNYLGVFGAPPGGLLNPGDVRYIINPLPGETVAPWNVGTPTTFPDTEYQQEFAPNLIPTSAPSLQWINASAPPTGLANPLYKWVRINAVTVGSQQSLNVLVNPIATAPNTPVFYANNRLSVLTPGVQALEITSLAASPNGSQRMLQYVVAPITYNLSFPAALTMEGSAAVTFAGPPTLTIDGTDTLPLGPSCTPGITPVVGLGVAGGAGTGGITGGSVLPPPGTQTVTPATNLQSVGSLDTLAQTVIANADVSKSGAQNQSIFPVTMSASNPVTIAVDGDLDLSTWGTAQGFGILLVTGTLTYDPSSSWSGIILVIGKGIVVSTGTGGGQIIGAALVAQTRDGLGNLLPALGPASWQTAGGSGIKYSSCWVQVVQTPITYKVLSFREIPQITP